MFNVLGIIRDFAGPYFVSENNMAFGKPTRYWKLNPDRIPAGINKRELWDRAVAEASDEYKMRMVTKRASLLLYFKHFC